MSGSLVPLVSLVSETVAPGIRPPDVSWTTPVTLPVTWAVTDAASTSGATIPTRQTATFCILVIRYSRNDLLSRPSLTRVPLIPEERVSRMLTGLVDLGGQTGRAFHGFTRKHRVVGDEIAAGAEHRG